MKRITLVIALALALASCNKTKENPESLQNTSDLTINTSVEELKARIEYLNTPVSFSNNGKSLDYNLVASIHPAEINGVKLSATCVVAGTEKAYVAFHTKGNLIGGELLTIDIIDPSSPVIVQSAQSESLDFNDIYRTDDDLSLYVCGDEKNQSRAQAFFAELTLDENAVPGDMFNWKRNANAYSGNSVTITSKDGNEYIWMTSGSNGGLEVASRSNPDEMIFSFNASYTKQFDADRNFGAVVFGIQENLSVIRVFQLDNEFQFTDYQIPYDVTLLGKNSLVVERNLAYLAMGNNGLVVFDLEAGEIVQTFKADGGTANAVFVEKDFVYLAYGSAGLYILDAASLENLGNWRYDGSCNFVYVEHETVFVANGDGEGFLVLQQK